MIGLAGPTHFSQMLQQIIDIVRYRGNIPVYNILLILTDGEIHDFVLTKDLIVQASNLPISIIIVGVGEEKFKQMKMLDSDDELLRDSQGNRASRDVVQFVKYRKYAD